MLLQMNFSHFFWTNWTADFRRFKLFHDFFFSFLIIVSKNTLFYSLICTIYATCFFLFSFRCLELHVASYEMQMYSFFCYNKIHESYQLNVNE